MVLINFFYYATLTPMWVFSRFILCLAAIFFIPKAIAGAVGILISPLPILVFLIFYSPAPNPKIFIRLSELKELYSVLSCFFKKNWWPIILHTGFSAICYLDVILVYFFYTKKDLGLYSASVLIPKILPIFILSFNSLIISSWNRSSDTRRNHGLFFIASLLIIIGLSIPLALIRVVWPDTCFGGSILTDCQSDIFLFSWIASTLLCIIRLSYAYSVVDSSSQKQTLPCFVALIVGCFFLGFETDMAVIANHYLIILAGLSVTAFIFVFTNKKTFF